MVMRITSRRTTSIVLALAAAAMLLAGCRGENRPNVEILGGASASISGTDDPALNAAGMPKYRMSSQQDTALQMSLDLRDLRSIINLAIDGRPVEWERARALYEQGRNQKRPDGTIRSLASLADADAESAFPNGAAVYGRARFIDGIIRDGLTGTGRAQGLSDDSRRAIVDRGVQMLFYARATHGIALAKTRFEAKSADAPATLDEAWAIIAGPNDADGIRTYSILNNAVAREAEFKLAGRLAQPMENEFIAALAATQKGDAAALNRHAADAAGFLNATFALGVMRSAKQAEGAGSEATRQTYLAEGWTSYQAIRALVASGSPAQAAALEAILTRPAGEAFPATETAKVYAALNAPAVLRVLAMPGAVRVATPPAGS